MGLVAWFQGILDRVSPRSPPAFRMDADPPPDLAPPRVHASPLSSLTKEDAAAIMAAYESGSLNPPRDPHDQEAWNTYWKNQLTFGALEQSFNDQMSFDDRLPKFLAERGVRTILCAGNGLSMEGIALALHGFIVTALDISTVAVAVFQSALRDPKNPLRRIEGFRLHDDGSLSFDEGAAIDPSSCPPMHQSADYPPKGGGSLSFVSGDLFDIENCRGPFDVVLERRTVQLFPEAEKATALERLTARLAPRGIFVSHEHQGFWRPGDDRRHYAEGWLASHGFVLDAGKLDWTYGPRLARLFFSTG